jgi:hypothetical protein
MEAEKKKKRSGIPADTDEPNRIPHIAMMYGMDLPLIAALTMNLAI